MPSVATRARADVRRFAEFCSALTLETGAPMILEPFQRRMLSDYFAGATETLILLSKKNGKTTLFAALALFHLMRTPDAECVIGATSRDQAGIMFDQAAGFVRRSEALRKHVIVKAGYREIRSRHHAGRVRVLAADVDTADGVIPTLALVDELGRHRSAGLYGIFRDGLGPRGGQMVAISVAGDHESSPLGLMRAAARNLPVQRRRGKHLYAASTDGSFVLHEWSLDPDDDVDDVRTVKKANPASWQTLDELQRRHDSPSMLSWQWARFACGIWTGAEAFWLSADDWRACELTGETIEDGELVTIGFDGSRLGDATAIVACRVSDGLLSPVRVWEPPLNARVEWEVPAGEVDAAIADAMERYAVVRGYFDPPLWQTEIDGWAREYGDRAVMRYPTNRSRMQGATERFRTDLVAGKLVHDGDDVLSRHVLNAQIREARGGYWLTKSRPASEEKIDAAVAAVLAYEARADALTAGDDQIDTRSRGLVTF